MDWGDFWEQAAQWAITWIPVLGPLGILTTAVVAYFAYRQKLEADRRAQWWVRAQWALEASLSANPRRSLAGLAVLNDLRTSSLATREDRELFRLIGLTVQEEILGGEVRGEMRETAQEEDRGEAQEKVRGESRRPTLREPHAREAAPQVSAPSVSPPSALQARILEQANELLAPLPTEATVRPSSSGAASSAASGPASGP
ncbi:hypothetical protein [Arthrobacter sp.]|uniref:hypothetical protein n=1 Tax=Arthrobacter sp. TaxID=1667 RepID=UPI0028A1E683|nr:hypothetical protein [Arthrobacter sp.]